MVLLFVLGGAGVLRPALLELLPDLDWDPHSAFQLFDPATEPGPEAPEQAVPDAAAG
ncbi:hypothetical protein [Sanguibacter antarcticus]|nr:hypothetical protein [Sanguibacter antarcticus]